MRFQQRCEPFPFIKGKPCCITGGCGKAFHSRIGSKSNELLYNNQRVILLTFLDEKIFPIDEIFGC